MIYFIIGIILLTLFQIYLAKDINKIIKIESIVLILSGYLMIILNYILKIVINRKITYINISKITNIIFKKCINRGLILITFGSILLIIYTFISIYNKRRIISK